MTDARPEPGNAMVLDLGQLGADSGEDPSLERELLQSYLLTAESGLLRLRAAIASRLTPRST